MASFGAPGAAAQGLCDDEADFTAYSKAKIDDSASGYRSYIETFPEGCFIEEARSEAAEKADAEAFQAAMKAQTAPPLEQYLADFPDGEYVSMALTQLELLVAQAKAEAAPPDAPEPEPEPTAPAVADTPAPTVPDEGERLATFNRFAGVRVTGSMLGRSRVEDVDACAAQCRARDNCKAYTLAVQTKFCTMFDGVQRATFSDDHDAGSLVSITIEQGGGTPAPTANAPAATQPAPSVAQPAPQPVQPAQPRMASVSFEAFTHYGGTDVAGGDFTDFRDVSLGTCLSFCSASDRCRAITYNMPNRMCFMKSSAGRYDPNPDAYSAVKR